MKKNIAVLYGGDSSEWEISMKSGKQVSEHIDKARYNVYNVLIRGVKWVVQQPGAPDTDIDKNDFSATIDGQKIKFDCAFIVIHGTPGEDGLLQSYFDLLHIRYTSCSAFVSALTMNKYATKCFLRDAGITMAKDVYVHKNEPINYDVLVAALGLPLFVKPNDSGSSFGVTKVKSAAELPRAFDAAFAESNAALVEECIAGREFAQGVFRQNGKPVLLPITEIISQNEFFDYQAKYENKSTEVTPADIAPELAKRISEQSQRIYEHLGCQGIVRVDYIVRGNDMYFIEVNTVPGMSQASIVPQQIRATGKSLAEAYTLFLEEAMA